MAASTWTLAGYGLSQAIRLGSNLVMTRLLVPDMFGVMAIATIVMVGLAMFSDLGLKQNIVQSRRGSDPAFLNTAWVVQIVRGAVLWMTALAISLFVLIINYLGNVPRDSVYANRSLPGVIAIVSFSAVIAGLSSTKLFEASRRLELGRVTQIEITAQITGLLFMFGWVLVDRSIWAMVAGSLAGAVTSAILSHTWLRGVTNRWQWDTSAFREIVHFGKWIFLSSILGFLVLNSDRLLLGGLIDATTLGVYVIAFNMFSSLETVSDRVMSNVSYSALSEVARERPSELKESYYRFHVVIAPIAYFCAGVLMYAGQPLIELLYDDRYQQAGWMLEILSVALITTPFHLAYHCLLALGFPSLFTSLIAIRGVSLFLLLPLGFHYFGLEGALWAIVASHFATLPAVIYFQIRHGFFNLSRELLSASAWIAGVMVAGSLHLAFQGLGILR
jgi:O-antigen/teichoic acid export membrane protein